MDILTNAAMWSLIIGFISPPILSLIQQPSWSARVQSIVAFAFFVIAGAGTAYFAGQFEGKDIISSILLVTVLGITSYKGIWKPTGIAPAIEKATSPGDNTV